MKKKVTMVWDDVVSQSVTNTFDFNKVDGSLNDHLSTAVDVFLNSIASLTNAGLKRVSVSYSSERGAEDVGNKMPDGATEFNTVDQKLVFNYMEEVAENDWREKSIELPAPIATIFELVPGQGKRLKAEHATNLVNALSDFSGHQCIAKEGWFKSDK